MLTLNTIGTASIVRDVVCVASPDADTQLSCLQMEVLSSQLSW